MLGACLLVSLPAKTYVLALASLNDRAKPHLSGADVAQAVPASSAGVIL
jgi:hypothetical protein